MAVENLVQYKKRFVSRVHRKKSILKDGSYRIGLAISLSLKKTAQSKEFLLMKLRLLQI